MAVCKLEREGRGTKGHKLIDVPGYTFRAFVITRAIAEEAIGRDYNRRAVMENRIAELKHDLAAGRFSLAQHLFVSKKTSESILHFALTLGWRPRRIPHQIPAR